jgi:hypothetical protein
MNHPDVEHINLRLSSSPFQLDTQSRSASTTSASISATESADEGSNQAVEHERKYSLDSAPSDGILRAISFKLDQEAGPPQEVPGHAR